MRQKSLPSWEYLNECFNYDPDTGVLSWKVRPAHHFMKPGRDIMFNNTYAGKNCTTVSNTTGYVQVAISVNGKKEKYRAHRVIHKLMTGLDPDEIDHVNHIRDDNRWVNLREVSSTQNKQNLSMHLDNIAGYKGVTFHPPTQKYMVRIQVNKKPIYIGLYVTAELAHEAYLAASKQHFGEFHYL